MEVLQWHHIMYSSSALGQISYSLQETSQLSGGFLQCWLLSWKGNKYENLPVLVLSSSVHCFHCTYSIRNFVIPVFVQQWLCNCTCDCTSVLVQICHVKWSQAGVLADNLVVNVILSVLSWEVRKPVIPWKINDSKATNYLHEKGSPAKISCYGFCSPWSPGKKIYPSSGILVFFSPALWW